MADKIFGLIAGAGDLPRVLATEARKMGYKVFAVGLDPMVDASFKEYVDVLEVVHVGKIGSIIKALKGGQVKEAIMAGKVPKTLLSKNQLKPDLKAATMILKLKDKSDDQILAVITDEFEKAGVHIKKITDFAPSMVTPTGVLTKRGLEKSESKDIAFGLPIAKAIGGMDIGQTVVVYDRAVMAIEAIEGTDAAIARGCSLCEAGAVVVKVSKPAQDMRFDVPTAGIETLKAMISGRARVLALEAGKTILVNKEAVITMANDAGITITGI